MIKTDVIADIRRALRKGHSYRDIAEACKVSVGYVQKVQWTNALEFEYKRAPEKQQYPQLGEYRIQLEEMLLEDLQMARHKRRKWSRLFEELQRLGYQGQYDAVRRYANKWTPPPEDKTEEKASVPADACTPQTFKSGHAFQFDWSEERVVINEVEEKIYVAQFTLCHSRMKFMQAYRRQQLEMVFDAHKKAFEFFGGVSEMGIYDNMTTAVKTILKGKDREWNEQFWRMCSFYCFEPRACTPRRGNEKGMVERAVQTNREDFFKTRPRVASLEELNRLIEDECLYRARTRKHPVQSDKTVHEVFFAERPALMSFDNGYCACREKEAKSSKTLLVRYDNNHYSVNYMAANTPVTVRAYAGRIVIFHKDCIVGEHERCFASGKIRFHIEHYIPILKVKPGSVRDGAPYQEEELPEGLARLRRELEKKKDFEKQFVRILSAVMVHGLSNVVAACELALEDGTVSADIVLNTLSRSTPRAHADLLGIDECLKLKTEPSSDCAEYDRFLRRDTDVESRRSAGVLEGAEDEGGGTGVRRGCRGGSPSPAERGCDHPGTAEIGSLVPPVGVREEQDCCCETPDVQKALGV